MSIQISEVNPLTRGRETGPALHVFYKGSRVGTTGANLWAVRPYGYLVHEIQDVCGCPHRTLLATIPGPPLAICNAKNDFYC